MERIVTRQEVAPLLRDSPFKNRIDYLLDNQNLGSKLLMKLSGNYEVYPNCFGTALFLLGAEREFLNTLNHQFSENDMIVSISGNKSFAVFPKKFDRPGILQPNHMKMFLSHCEKVDSLQPGVITYEEGVSRDGIYHHSMVFLGKLGKMNYFFQQAGLGERFNFKFFEEFNVVPAVSQEELRKDAVLALDMHSWTYGDIKVRDFYRYPLK